MRCGAPGAGATPDDVVAAFSRNLVEVNARRPEVNRRLAQCLSRTSAAKFAEPVSSNHYDIDTSVKTIQHAIHSLFSTVGLGRGHNGMGEDN